MNAILELPEVRARVSRISVEDYHKQPERNENGKRTELIRGIVIEKMSKSPLHKTIGSRLYRIVLRHVGSGYCAWKDEPLTFVDSEPEPDISIVRGAEPDFERVHASTAALVVEVAVSSVRLDRELAALYAEAGVEEYWIVLAREKAVEIYRRPVGGVYQEKTTVAAPATLACASVPGLAVPLAELFA